MHPPDPQGFRFFNPFNRLPSGCEVCGQWPAQDGWGALCGSCIDLFASPVNRCGTCAIELTNVSTICPSCASTPPPLAHCFASLDYKFPWIGLIHRFKFQSEPGWKNLLAKLMLRPSGAADLLLNSDLIMPIPMSPKNLGERGYNQAWLLAKAASKEVLRRPTPSPGAKNNEWLSAKGLVKITETSPQHRLDRALRQHNIKDAFAVAPSMLPVIVDKHITLIDDIMTTGATLHAAAIALHRAGAASVSACVLARTPAPQNPVAGQRSVSGKLGEP